MLSAQQVPMPAPPSRRPGGVYPARSILVPSKVPGMDYALNPYVGCAFGCTYCYATFMGRLVGRKPQDWGRFVYAKANLESVMARELRRLGRRPANLFMSSVTDPYQGVERRWQLTRRALELLVAHGFTGRLQVLTRSPLVCRDIELLEQIHHDVGITITSSSDSVSRAFEGASPSVERRLEALAQLNARGLDTHAFVGPLFPHLLEAPRQLDRLFGAIAETGCKEVYVAHFNLSRSIRDRVQAGLARDDQALWNRWYRDPIGRPTKAALGRQVRQLLKRHGLLLREGVIIDH